MRKHDGLTHASTESAEPSTDESFLGRWSRRKRQVRDGQALDDNAASETELQPVTEANAEDATSEDAANVRSAPERVLTDEDMPALSTLTADSDYSCFMSEGVSEELRRVALRKLFSSPQFNIRDGLNDYDEDFTTFEALGDIVTSDMRHQQELEAQRLEERKAAAESESMERADGEAADTQDTAQDTAQETESADGEKTRRTDHDDVAAGDDSGGTGVSDDNPHGEASRSHDDDAQPASETDVRLANAQSHTTTSAEVPNALGLDEAHAAAPKAPRRDNDTHGADETQPTLRRKNAKEANQHE